MDYRRSYQQRHFKFDPASFDRETVGSAPRCPSTGKPSRFSHSDGLAGALIYFMYNVRNMREFGLGAVDADYLKAGARVELWVSLSSVPKWAAIISPLLMIGRAKNIGAENKIKAAINSRRGFSNTSVAIASGFGSATLSTTTTIDFARADDVEGALRAVLQQNGFGIGQTIFKVVKYADGATSPGILNTANPDTRPTTSGSVLENIAIALGVSSAVAVGVLILGGVVVLKALK